MAGTDEGGPAADAPVLDLRLHQTIRFLQLQNGLRHSDYQRYRHYATRRLRRLRLRAKATHGGKGKTFTTKQVTVEAIGGVEKLRQEHLLLMLLNAERAWAFAMQIKQDSAGAHLPSFRRKHLLRRLRRAALWATRLQEVCKQSHERLSERSLLEVEAYALVTSSAALMEGEQWREALAKLTPAHSILSQLGEVGTLEEQDLFANRAEEVLQSVRYCKYNLGEGSSENTEALLAKMKASGSDMVPEALREKLASVMASSRREQAGQITSLEWRGRSLPLTTEAMQEAVLRVREAEKQLDEGADADDADALYTQLYSALDEALRVVSSEESVLSSMSSGAKVEATQRDLRLLKASLSHSKLARMAARNTALVRRLLSSPGGRRAEDVVHVYDALVQNAADALKLPGIEDLDDLHTETEALEKLYRGRRAFYMAEYYATQADNNMPKALVLYELAGRVGEEAEEALAALEGMDEQTADARDLVKQAQGGRYRALALSLLKGPVLSKTDKLASQLAALTLSPPRAGAPSGSKPKGGGGKGRRGALLLDRLESLDAGSEADGFALAALPPELAPLRPKPQLFDIAFNSLEARLPDLAARAGAPQKDTARRGLFGWLRG